MNLAKIALERLDAYYKRRKEKRRGYLGASAIGGDCARALWYGFRWADQEQLEPRMLRLFERGDREEDVFVRYLWAIGCEYWPVNPATRKQYVVKFPNPHLGGHCDGAGTGLPDLPAGVRFVGEFKTHNEKQFNKLEELGVRVSHRTHFVQAQLYMHGLGIGWALYGGVCKNDDRLHLELLEYDAKEAERYLARADTIVYSQQPPARLSSNPVYYRCKWCEFQKVCHYNEPMVTTCRTCTHAVPLPYPATNADAGAWFCNKHRTELSIAAQEAACDQYVQLVVKD